jgi:hypothetical protein
MDRRRLAPRISPRSALGAVRVVRRYPQMDVEAYRRINAELFRSSLTAKGV